MWLWLAAAAWGADPAAWNGQWELDLAASSPLDDLLALQGVSWVERKAVANMGVTQAIEASEAQMVVEVRSLLRSTRETLVLDGLARPQDTRSGPASVRHAWASDGSLLTTIDQVAGAGCPCTLTLIRSVSDDVLEQRFHFVRSDGATADAVRVLRRVP